MPVDAFDVSIIGDWPVTVSVSGHRADFQRDVERDELLRADRDALLRVGLVALQRDSQLVRAWREVRESCIRRRSLVVVDCRQPSSPGWSASLPRRG